MNKKITVYDDGKRGRGTDGEVLSVIDDTHILVRFDPYGYPSQKGTLLVFTKNKYGDYEALNPLFGLWKENRDIYRDSEYCLIRKEEYEA
jgi:hypothetical protein